jgi:hypothetical protein
VVGGRSGCLCVYVRILFLLITLAKNLDPLFLVLFFSSSFFFFLSSSFSSLFFLFSPSHSLLCSSSVWLWNMLHSVREFYVHISCWQYWNWQTQGFASAVSTDSAYTRWHPSWLMSYACSFACLAPSVSLLHIHGWTQITLINKQAVSCISVFLSSNSASSVSSTKFLEDSRLLGCDTVAGSAVPDVSDCLILKGEGTVIVCYTTTHSPPDTASHPRSLALSATSLW